MADDDESSRQVLPDHVIEDIMARLPAKSVLRCRCLSRAWAAALSSGDLVERHRHHQLHHGDGGGPTILFLQDWLSLHEEAAAAALLPKVVHAWSPDHPGGTTLMEVPRALRLRHRCPLQPLGSSFSRRSSWRSADRDNNLVPRLVTQQCRGLLILEATGTGTHFVFNPFTRQIAALPEGRLTGGASRRHGSDDAYYASFGIGYDDTSVKKHKVVRVFYRGCDSDKLPASVGCEVYVINSSSTAEAGLWRPPANNNNNNNRACCCAPTGWINQKETSVFAQGRVHWLAKRRLDSPSQEMFVVSFSLGDETFGTLQLPPDIMEMRNSHRHYLTELGGVLCLFSTQLDQQGVRPHRYYVWLLRRRRRREHETTTWDLHCRIDVDTLPREVATVLRMGVALTPLCVMDDARIVLVQPRHFLARGASFKLHAYDPATGDMENLITDRGDGGSLVSTNTKRMVLKHAALYHESISYPGQPHVDIILAMSLVLRMLPTKTLARLKCVSRSWHDMIESKAFSYNAIYHVPI